MQTEDQFRLAFAQLQFFHQARHARALAHQADGLRVGLVGYMLGLQAVLALGEQFKDFGRQLLRHGVKVVFASDYVGAYAAFLPVALLVPASALLATGRELRALEKETG